MKAKSDIPVLVPRKQRAAQADWLRAWEEAPRLISRAHVERRMDEAIAEMTARLGDFSRVAYGWSGGKDSQLLRFVLERAGVFLPCVLIRCNLEYPAFVSWVAENQPQNLEVINTGEDLEWLAKNQHMLFPTTSAQSSRWFQRIQWNGERQFSQRHQLRAFLLGRRYADGNFTGRDGQYDNRGVSFYSPIRSWTHEEVLAAIRHFDIALPPNYWWVRGFRTGTGPWAKRRVATWADGWAEIYQIDPTIIHDAARLIPSAREFLETVEAL